MAEDNNRLTVYRSADAEAEEDARAIGELLSGEGLHPEVLDDSAPGVPSGAWEVRVPPAESARADELIANAALPDTELTEVDQSEALDLETVFTASGGTTQELETSAVRGILEGAGIATVLVGDPVLPNLDFEIRVARDRADEARRLIAEAEASGPAAAEAAANESVAEPEVRPSSTETP